MTKAQEIAIKKFLQDHSQKRFQDSTMSYFISQLASFDKTLHMPLASYTWSRDIDLRVDVTWANTSTIFSRNMFAAGGTLSNAGKTNIAWDSLGANVNRSVSTDSNIFSKPIRTVTRQLQYGQRQLEISQALGTPIDVQQEKAYREIYNMETDMLVYTGDSTIGSHGLVNSAEVVSELAPNDGTGGSRAWENKTVAQILRDINTVLTNAWTATAWTYPPVNIILPPTKLSYLGSQIVSTAGNMSILKYLQENNLAALLGLKVNIVFSKWCIGSGAGATDRMVVYTKNPDLVRFPHLPPRQLQPFYNGEYVFPYQTLYGEMEFVYPETLRYLDGI